MISKKERVFDEETFDRRVEFLSRSFGTAPIGMKDAVVKLDTLTFVTAALDAYVGVDCWTAADAVALTKVVFEERDRELRREAAARHRELEDHD
jgi:hypothetical protein